MIVYVMNATSSLKDDIKFVAYSISGRSLPIKIYQDLGFNIDITRKLYRFDSEEVQLAYMSDETESMILFI